MAKIIKRPAAVAETGISAMDKEKEYILSALKEDGYKDHIPYLSLRPAKRGDFIVASYDRTEPYTDRSLISWECDGHAERDFAFSETITVHPDLDTTVLEVVDFLEFCQKEIMQSFD